MAEFLQPVPPPYKPSNVRGHGLFLPPLVQPDIASQTVDGSNIGSDRAVAYEVDTSTENLKSAFELFNDLSLQLASSYQLLENKVVELTAELDVVSEQRLEELQEKEQFANRLETLINFLPGGVIVLDHRGVIIEANPAAEDMLELSLKGKLWRDVIQRCFSPKDDDGHEVSNHQGKRMSIATRSLEKDGQIILLTDQTETRRLQSELSRHERLTALGKMVSTLAHQVRTPLSSAVIYANHLLDRSLAVPQQHQFTQKLVNRLHEIERQVRDMLLFVKGDMPVSQVLSVKTLRMQLCEAMEALLQNTEVKCDWQIPDEDIRFVCNSDALVGALLNLVDNSLQAMSDEGHLAIQIKQKNSDTLLLSVSDDGPGIPDTLHHQVQEMFYTTKSQGTGIGLSVVNTVAQSHGGKFSLSPSASGGVCATLELPIEGRFLIKPSVIMEE